VLYLHFVCCQKLTFSGFFALTASRSAMFCCLYASHSCTQTCIKITSSNSKS
jgi:hypothetical protein